MKVFLGVRTKTKIPWGEFCGPMIKYKVETQTNVKGERERVSSIET